MKASSLSCRHSEHLIIRRSFEIISLYLLPVHTLNLFLAPFVVDSKRHQETRGSKRAIDLGAGIATKQVIVPDHPAMLRVKSSHAGDSEEKEEDLSLTEFVRKHCTSLFEKWEPTWWLKRWASTSLFGECGTSGS